MESSNQRSFCFASEIHAFCGCAWDVLLHEGTFIAVVARQLNQQDLMTLVHERKRLPEKLSHMRSPRPRCVDHELALPSLATGNQDVSSIGRSLRVNNRCVQMNDRAAPCGFFSEDVAQVGTVNSPVSHVEHSSCEIVDS